MQKLILQKAVRGFSGAKAVLVLCLLMVSSVFAAVDFSTLQTSITDSFTGLELILLAVAAVLIGIYVVPVGVRFIKSVMR